MKKSAALLSLFILISSLAGQAQNDWQQISQPGTRLNIVDETTSYCFVNQTVGSHGSKYTLKKSEDGSHTFTVIKTKTGDFGCYSMEEMFFLDADTGFFSEVCQGISSIYKTTDRGANWTSTGMGGSFGISMFFLRADYGYHSFFPGEPNDSYLIRNGSTAFVTKKYKFSHNNYQYPGQKTEIFFKNDSTGLIMCMDSLDNAVVIKSADYGSSWETTKSKVGQIFTDMTNVSDETMMVVGSNGTIIKSEDFGDSWTNILISMQEDMNSIDFLDNGTGYIVGNSGTLLKSTDYGNTWTTENFIHSNDLIYVRVFDENLVFVLDENGILYINDGGSSIDEQRNAQINIFPNPASEEIHVKNTLNNHPVEFNIIDMQGRKLITSSIENIDIRSIPKGIYILEIKTKQGNYTERFIKH